MDACPQRPGNKNREARGATMKRDLERICVGESSKSHSKHIAVIVALLDSSTLLGNRKNALKSGYLMFSHIQITT